jgi:hypothetical protein
MAEVRDALHEMYSAEVRRLLLPIGFTLAKASLRCNESAAAPESTGPMCRCGNGEGLDNDGDVDPAQQGGQALGYVAQGSFITPHLCG